MKANPGMPRQHKIILTIVIALGVFLGVFFLAPVVHVIDTCTNSYESPGYYLWKVGYRIYFGPTGCI